jgi:hypothetical protein
LTSIVQSLSFCKLHGVPLHLCFPQKPNTELGDIFQWKG